MAIDLPHSEMMSYLTTSYYASYNAVKKILLKNKNKVAKDNVYICDEYNKYNFNVVKGQRHNFSEFSDLRTTVHARIGRELDICPRSTTITIHVPTWYRCWYNLLMEDLHSKGFRVSIYTNVLNTPYIPNDSTANFAICINGEDKKVVPIHFDSYGNFIGDHLHDKVMENVKFNVFGSLYFDQITIRPAKPYKDRLPDNEASCLLTVFGDKDSDLPFLEILVTTKGKIKAGTSTTLSTAYLKKYNTSNRGVELIDLKYLYHDTIVNDHFKNFIEHSRLSSSSYWTHFSDSDYTDSRIYFANRANELKSVVEILYNVYNQYFAKEREECIIIKPFSNPSSAPTNESSNVLQ